MFYTFWACLTFVLLPLNTHCPLSILTQAKQEITILSQTIEAEHPELFAYLATAHANQHLEHQLAKLKEALADSWAGILHALNARKTATD